MMTKIKIGPLVYDVNYIDEVVDDDDLCYGMVEHVSQVIDIDKTSTEERQKMALFHEVLHVLNHEYQLGLVEEQIITITSSVIDTLNRNKWFREKMCK